MLSTLYILNYNNYYNRIVKSERNITDYLTAGTLVHTLSGTNFNPNDFINTEHTFGDVNNQYGGTGDYVLVTENNEIVSKWFIIEAQRSRSGQWILTLRRDVIVDYWDLIKTAPTFIEKGLVSNDSPFIYNSENMTFNQKKVAEYALKDSIGCPWIIGYYDGSKGAKTIEEEAITNFDLSVNLTTWDNAQYQENDFIGTPSLDNVQYLIYWGSSTSPASTLYRYTMSNLSYQRNTSTKYTSGVAYSGRPASAETMWNALSTYNTTGFKFLYDEAKNYIGYHSAEETNAFLNLNNKILKDVTTNKYYRISFTSEQKTIEVAANAGNLYESLKSVMLSIGATAVGSNPFFITTNVMTYRMKLTEMETAKMTVTIPDTSNRLEDAPYKMFAMPYPNESMKIGNLVIDKDLHMRMAAAISKLVEGGYLYDIQLLPYAPELKLPKDSLEEGKFNIPSDYELGKNYTYITSVAEGDSQNVGIMFFPFKSSFTLNIPFGELSINNPKIQVQTDMCRLVSPNYNGQFEFNIVKNGGLQYFNVDCTYLPFNPYIHINPNFGGLYVQDWDDARGLICGGDFSLPIMKDAWTTYQIQNKNFQNIFDRQIQNMEVQNKYQGIQDIVSAVSGTFQGAASGSFIGSMTGIGGVPGAIAGGILSAGAGIADVGINKALRNEAIDFTKDNFGYQLGNIQALPNSLSRTTAYTFNNKIFPILEYYTCTEEEKIALANKIAYNGMTVMVIGAIEPMLQIDWSYKYIDKETGNKKEINSKKYIKGKVIKLNSLGEDFHVAKEISNEINNGFFYEYVN